MKQDQPISFREEMPGGGRTEQPMMGLYLVCQFIYTHQLQSFE